MKYDAEAVARLSDPMCWADAGIDTPALVPAWWAAGFEPDDVTDWFQAARYVLAVEDAPLDLRALPGLAATWRCAGFAVEEVRGWRDTLCNFDDRTDLVHEARRWRAAGFTPETALHWRQWGMVGGEHELDAVLQFEAAGWRVGHAAALYMLARGSQAHVGVRLREWLSLGLGPDRTLDYVKAAVTPEQALALEKANLRPDVLEAELQARYEAAEPIDQFYAMHLNHQCGMAFGMNEDDESKWPFWARHLPDLHDTEGASVSEGSGTA